LFISILYQPAKGGLINISKRQALSYNELEETVRPQVMSKENKKLLLAIAILIGIVILGFYINK
jgi:hypothetical protein